MKVRPEMDAPEWTLRDGCREMGDVFAAARKDDS